MELIKLKPITNGTRHQLNIKKRLLSKKNNLVKGLTKGLKTHGGRSATTGRITVRHQGGRCKRLYRHLKLNNKKVLALVLSILYDPNRSSFIFFNYNLYKQTFFYSLATHLVIPGTIIGCFLKLKQLRLGYRLPLACIPPGSLINSLSLNFNSALKYIRAAGTYGQLLQKKGTFCSIKLPSGKIIELSSLTTVATIGVMSNLKHNLIILGKAGRNRKKGKRPAVRGIAMNPVDHPHGGRTNGGMAWVTPWGIPTKGKPTVKKKKFIK